MVQGTGAICASVLATDPKTRALGLELQVFIEVTLTSQRKEAHTAFEEAIVDMPEVLEVHLII